MSEMYQIHPPESRGTSEVPGGLDPGRCSKADEMVPAQEV